MMKKGMEQERVMEDKGKNQNLRQTMYEMKLVNHKNFLYYFNQDEDLNQAVEIHVCEDF